MDLKLATVLTITAALAVSATGNPVPPNSSTAPASSPKYVPVFISADALNRVTNERDRQTAQPVESGQDKLNDINKGAQNALYGPPAPVYEHQPDQHETSYTPPPMPQNYQNNQQQYQNMQTPIQQANPNQQPIQQSYPNQQPINQQQYQNMQTPIQQANPNQQPIQQSYPNQQPINQQHFQTQQPNQIQQYQISQPQSQPFYPINQQPAQPNQILVAQQTGSQPLYGNQQQQQILPINQQPLLNQQQLIAQPVQTYQQPNQLLISQPGNQQLLTQSTQPILLSQQGPMPNQQILLQPNQNGLIQQIPNQQGQQAIILQPNQNGQIITSNMNPIQPNQVNPGYIQNQNQNVYAVVPLNGQNHQNVGSNTYLVPVQQVPNQVFAVNSG